MNLDKFLPVFGVVLLSGMTIFLGQWALTSAPIVVATDTLSVPDPEIDSHNTGARRLTFPSARPEIYYNAILERPLFAPTRAPQDSEPELGQTSSAVTTQITPVATSAPATDIRLSGIIGSENNRSALLGSDDSNKDWMQVDDTINGWSITEIGADWVELSLDHQTYRLELFE